MEIQENIYKVKNLSDNGVSVTLTLIEDMELEPVSQQQLMLEAINRAIPDKDMKRSITTNYGSNVKSATPNSHPVISSNTHNNYNA